MSPCQVKLLCIPAKYLIAQHLLLSLCLRLLPSHGTHSVGFGAVQSSEALSCKSTGLLSSWNLSTLLSSPLLMTTVASSSTSSTWLCLQKVVFGQHSHMRSWNGLFMFCVPPCKHFSRRLSSASVVNIGLMASVMYGGGAFLLGLPLVHLLGWAPCTTVVMLPVAVLPVPDGPHSLLHCW